MGRYTNIYCSRCKHSFTGGYSRLGLDSNLGLPFLKCPNCGQIYKTRKKPWSQMTKFDKTTLVINRIVQAIINTLLPAFLFLMAGHYIFQMSEEDISDPSFLIFIAIISFVISFVYMIYNTKKYIRITEEAFKKGDYTSFFR